MTYNLILMKIVFISKSSTFEDIFHPFHTTKTYDIYYISMWNMKLSHQIIMTSISYKKYHLYSLNCDNISLGVFSFQHENFRYSLHFFYLERNDKDSTLRLRL